MPELLANEDRPETREERHLREQRELLHDHDARVASHVNVPDLTEAQRSARMAGVCRVYARAALELINRQRDETAAVPPAEEV